MDWMDFNKDGKVDIIEKFMGMDMLCSSKEEHEAMFGDTGDFDDELEMAELDRDELEFMDEDERREALEDAGLDPDDYEF